MRRECRERFSPPRVSNPDMHHGSCVTHVPWCMPEWLTGSFLWSRWRGKRSRHSRRMHNPQFYVSGKRPMMGRLWCNVAFSLMNRTTISAAERLYTHDDVMAWKRFPNLLTLCKKKPLFTNGFPSPRASDAKAWCFLYYQFGKLLHKQSSYWIFVTS